MALSTLVASSVAHGSIIHRQNTLSAISVPPSGVWLGNDGNWSTFEIQVGNPPQSFNVLPSTNRYEYSIPAVQGCPDDWNITDCGFERGVYTSNAAQDGFQLNSSTSWQDIGVFQFLQRQTPYSVTSQYGLDTVVIGNSSIDVDISLQNQTVATFDNQNLWVGNMGLDPRPLTLDSPRIAPLQALKDAGRIPSLSYGYTAGAYYVNGGTPGSLTLGGFDRNLMSPQSVTSQIDMDARSGNSKGALRLGVTSITRKGGAMDDRVLSDTPITMPIDTTVPELWLPRSVCDQFEQAFNLTYSALTDRYIMTPAVARSFASAGGEGPTVEFVISDGISGSNSTTINVPYAAFNLRASYRIFLDGEVPYFPIRRAANDTQYVLGRAFMQAAYVFADYERGNFTVTQTYNAASPRPDIVTVTSISDRGGPTPTPDGNLSNGGLSTGAKAGIAVGVILIVVIAAVGAFFWWRRRRNRGTKTELPADESTQNAQNEKNDDQTAWQANAKSRPVHELEARESGARSPTLASVASPLVAPSELETPTPELEAQEARMAAPSGSGEKRSRLTEYR